MNPTRATRRNATLIRGMQYFEAVARHGSVSNAAAELGVTQSAVSHQIRELSEALGEQLLVRAGRGVALTMLGHRLAARLALTFSDLQTSIDDIVGGSDRKILRLAVCSSFGQGWLIPRLESFMEAHPDVQVQLNLTTTHPELSDQVADAMVTALPVRPGYESIHIVDEKLIAVTAPDSNRERPTLITTDIDPTDLGVDWVTYCNVAGIDLASIHSGHWLRSTHYILAMEMARNGLGVALVPDFLAKREIEAGNLVAFGKAVLPTGRSYHFCFKKARAEEYPVKVLGQWFRRQVQGTARLRHERAQIRPAHLYAK